MNKELIILAANEITRDIEKKILCKFVNYVKNNALFYNAKIDEDDLEVALIDFCKVSGIGKVNIDE